MEPITLRASEAPALLGENGAALTYRELLASVDAFARTLPAGGGRLVGLLGDRELGTVVAHLAALRTGHAVAWVGAARSFEHMGALVRRYTPEILVGSPEALAAVARPLGYRLDPAGPQQGVQVARIQDASAPELTTGTSLVLFTSGSVSGGRGVRLSGSAVSANAAGIRTALGFDASWRGATSLPLYYSYGLSILHSHLTAGGSVLLTDASATGPSFWRRFDALGCHVFNGVPAHYDWLDRGRLPWSRIGSLRMATCAGGPIRRSLAGRVHARCEENGTEFVKMYGQTEATARISVLRGDDYPAHPDSVGRVLDGSRVSFDADGQLLYHGPSAMFGYCDSRADLAGPDRMRGTVPTGDLGRIQDGLLYLTGRLARFIKPLGRRISLDAVESVFADLAPAAAVGDSAERAHVFVAAARGSELESTRRTLLDRFALPPDSIELHCGVELPRLPNGKTDYRRLTELVAHAAGETRG